MWDILLVFIYLNNHIKILGEIEIKINLSYLMSIPTNLIDIQNYLRLFAVKVKTRMSENFSWKEIPQ